MSEQRDLEAGALGGMVWLSGARAVQGVVKLLVLAILARLLTPEDFGLVAAAMAVIWFGRIFSGLGVAPALVQREALEERHVRAGASSALVLGSVAGVVTYFAAPLVSDFFQMEGLTPILRILAVLFPIQALAAVAERLLQREMLFDTIARIEVVSHSVGYGLIGVGLALAGGGVWALVGAHLAKESMKCGLFVRWAPHRMTPGLDVAALGELLRFGSGYSLGSLSQYFALQGDNLVIARFLGAGPLGLYGRAYELMVVPAKALGSLLDQVLFPAMSRVQQRPGRLARAFRRGLAVVAVTVLPASVATLVLAPELVETVLGTGWEGVVLPLQILAVGMYARIGYMVGQTVANATGAVYRAAWRSAVYATLVVVGAWVGQRWGIPGVAAAVLGAVTVNFLLITALAARLSGLGAKEMVAAHLPAIVLSAIIGAEAWALNRLLETLALPTVARFVLCLLGLAATFLASMRLARTGLLGDDVRWMLGILDRKSPERLQPWVRRVLGTERPETAGGR